MIHSIHIQITSLIIFCSLATSYSQDATHYCGTDQAVKEHMKENPNYSANQKKLESFTKAFTNNNKAKQGNLYIIPIVFHVIHNFGPENISEQQILDGLKIINDDFRKLNDDTSSIDSAFKGIAADSEIEFRLAQKDPDGNCTNGITRTASTQTYTADDGVKSLVRWPNERYLNVWLVQSIESGAGGYAYYPGAGPAIDGIVLRRSQFGGSYRSLTHEIGHYLNLPHTWGSSNNPEEPGNCNMDDGVSDTPNTMGNTVCDLDAVSCGSKDNVQNYMEYSFCDRMFTEGQKIRMHAALNSSASNRNNLSTAANLALTGTEESAVLCNVDFSVDRHVICENSTINFQDESYNGQLEWIWGFPGGTPNTSNLANPSITYNTSGVYNVNLLVTNGTDVLVELKQSHIVVQSEGSVMPLFESFEDFDFSDELYWEVVNEDNGNTWEPVGNVGYSGSSSLKMDNYTGNEDGRIDYFISPSLDLSDMQAANITFRVAFAQKTDSDNDLLKVYVSVDCGATWLLRYVKSGSSLASVSPTSSSFTPFNSGEWVEHVINLNQSDNVDGLKFKIEYLYQGGNNLYIDDINISGTPTTIPMLVSPYNGAVDQPISVTLNWNAVDSVDSYFIQIDTANDFSSPALVTWTNNYISTSDDLPDTEFQVDNLMGGSTTYYWRVRTMKNSVYSNWSAIWDFITTSQVVVKTNTRNNSSVIKVYPNPITNEATIFFYINNEIAELNISVLDVLGRKFSEVKKGRFIPGAYNEKIPKINASGIYFLKIEMDDLIFLKKIIVTKP